MVEKDLNNIFIRAQNKNGQWESQSLEKLIRVGLQKEIYFWFLNKIHDIVGIESFDRPDKITKRQVVSMLNVLDRCGVQVFRSKADADKKDL